MKLYSELEESIGMIINSMDETDTFKVRFEKLINNYFERSSSAVSYTHLSWDTSLWAQR